MTSQIKQAKFFQHRNQSNLKFQKTYVCQEDQHVKPCRKPYISSATVQVASDLLKALAILSDTIVRRYADDWEDVKLYWISNKRPHFSRWPTSLVFTSFSQNLLTTERKLIGLQFLATDLYPTLLNTGITDKTFHESRKQDSFRHILKSSVSMYESSGSQFFRTTTGTVRTRSQIKVGYDLLNQLGSF